MTSQMRRELEKKVVRALVDHLRQSGDWRPVEVYNGDWRAAVKAPYSNALTPDQVLEEVFAVDDSTVYFANPAGRKHWVEFVLGNSPEEVVSDYSFAPISNPDDFDSLMKAFDAEKAATS